MYEAGKGQKTCEILTSNIRICISPPVKSDESKIFLLLFSFILDFQLKSDAMDHIVVENAILFYEKTKRNLDF